MRLDKLTKAAVAALEDIKARDIVVLDVRKMTAMFDWIIIASADSSRQSRALANNVQEKMKALGARVVSVEGERTGEWVLVDLGSIVVHIMQPAVRQYYNLEELWAPPPRARRRRANDTAR
jgi:ribosome-associated protein